MMKADQIVEMEEKSALKVRGIHSQAARNEVLKD